MGLAADTRCCRLAAGPHPAQLDQIADWTRELSDAVQPFSFGGTDVNFLGEEGQDRVCAAYGEHKYTGLADLKRKYDPTNYFRLNQNIIPGASSLSS